MKKYSTVIFDLFDTIVNFNFNHLPSIELKGSRSRTTSIEVFDVFKKYYPQVSFGEFYKPFIDSYHEFQQMKSKEYREFPNRYRFELMLGKMDLEPVVDKENLENQMVLAHMKALSDCVEFPEENRKTLEYVVKQGYKMAIVSNFDFAPTAQMLIDKFEIRKIFEVIVISCDVGWRKPKDIIFREALDRLGVKTEGTLFVGDNYNADIVGSKSLGMDAAWIKRSKHPEISNNLKPDYTLTKLSELIDIL